MRKEGITEICDAFLCPRFQPYQHPLLGKEGDEDTETLYPHPYSFP